LLKKGEEAARQSVMTDGSKASNNLNSSSNKVRESQGLLDGDETQDRPIEQQIIEKE